MHVKCGEEWIAWAPPCKRDVLSPILSINDCGCCGKTTQSKESILPFLLDGNL